MCLLAVAEDGSVWTWGDGACGQLGHGDMLPRTVPTRIGALRAKIVLVSLGHWHSLAASVDGELLSWGYGRWRLVVLQLVKPCCLAMAAPCDAFCRGSYGQLGLGDRENRNVPTFVANLRGHPITWVCAGELHSTAVSVHGDAWTFGRGENGRLGHNDENDKLDPQRLGLPFLPSVDLFGA
jgi:E3 ubiquitin-protein ligase HERC4